MEFIEDIVLAVLVVSALFGGERIFWLAFGSFVMLAFIQVLSAENRQGMIVSIVTNDVLFELIEETISAIVRWAFKAIFQFAEWMGAMIKGAVIGVGWALKTVFASIFKSIFGAVAALIFAIFAAMRR